MHGRSCRAAFVTFGSTGYFGATAHEPARTTPTNARRRTTANRNACAAPDRRRSRFGAAREAA
ncbi:4-hydroxy-3-methylbut-2-en-1-yl diphosphate synthase [Burkholderia pseudomallei]|uniref:4-hydroxy-3-methylbut-2-en-1-yl diphosphate synthase n=1 Tax=Burkholderia pseudomallei TaxID=28450 RepID=UPI0028BE8E6D|nr:4-hydroxy-3-methylbut-2-en-1-yl diphosphate synthase [Burkholderia pseudomallei]